MESEKKDVVVHRVALDPTPEQEALLRRYANAYRCTYNYGNRLKDAAYRRWAEGRDALIAQGLSREEAAKKAPKVPSPSAFEMTKIFRANRDNGDIGFRWWDGVNENMCCQAFADVDRAWRNWWAGRAGFPRFKRKGRNRDAFRTQSAKFPDVRHLRIPGGGGQKAFSVRLHRPAARLFRDLNRGGSLGAVTVSRSGNRWFASANVRIPAREAPRPNRHQRAAGAVGVDLGVAVVAATSDPITVRGETVRLYANPRHLENAERSLKRWQRRAARRYQKGLPRHRQSRGWHEAQQHVARLHALVAARRADMQHHLTKALVTQYEHVVIEDLKVGKMTKSARGTVENPGRNVRQKAGLNRAILAVGFGEIRRQLEYKAPRYGARVTAVNPAYTSQTCDSCGHVDAKSRRTRSLFVCTNCGHATHADLGAARQIKKRGAQT